ncbi:tetratricopeptide repeat protein [Magnetococcus sp. PR-3]|uniref:tetratricopeptide repeat protein n=1 Tax=Magnetococcus sp. PR-3 TaxID=3120355 RepID=UPI002FCE3D05
MKSPAHKRGFGLLNRMAGLFVGICMTGLPLVSQSAPHALSEVIPHKRPNGPKQLSWNSPIKQHNSPLFVDERRSDIIQLPDDSLDHVLSKPTFNIPEGGLQIIALVDERPGLRTDFPTAIPSYYSWIQEMLQQPVQTVEMYTVDEAGHLSLPQAQPDSLADERPVGGQLVASLSTRSATSSRTMSRFTPPPRGMQRPTPQPLNADIPVIEMLPMDEPIIEMVPMAEATDNRPEAYLYPRQQRSEQTKFSEPQSIQVVEMVQLAQVQDTPSITLPSPEPAPLFNSPRTANTRPLPPIKLPEEEPPLTPMSLGIPLQPMMPARRGGPPVEPTKRSVPTRPEAPQTSSPTEPPSDVQRSQARENISLMSHDEPLPGQASTTVQDAPMGMPPRRREDLNGSLASNSASLQPAKSLTTSVPTSGNNAWLDDAIGAMPPPPVPASDQAGPYGALISEAQTTGQVVSSGNIESEDRAKLVLVWPEPINFEKKIKGRETLLRFNTHFNPKELDKSIADLKGWLSDVRYGYDTLLVRATMAGTGFNVVADGRSLIISMTRPPPEPERDERRAQTESRLRYLQTKAMREDKALYSAKARMTGLLSEDMQNIEFLAEQGNLEQDLGRWRRAVALYDRGLEQAPGEFNIVYAKANQIYTHTNWADVGQTFKNSTNNNERQVSSTARYHHTFRHHWDATLKVEHGSIAISNLVRGDGSTTTRAEEDWWSEGVTLGYDYDNGDRAELGLHHTDKGVTGASAKHIWTTPFSSRTTLEATYREMYTGLAVAVADGGHRSKLELSRLDFWPNSWRSILTAGVNHYGINEDENAAESVTLSASFRYDLLQRPNQEVSYTVEKEMVDNLAERYTAGGAPYFLLPLEDRETHSINFGWFEQITDYLRYDAAVGYSYDRLTKAKGPAWQLGLTYEPLADLETGIRAQGAVSSTQGTVGRTETINWFLRIRF